MATYRELLPDLSPVLIVAGGHETDTDALVEEGRRRLGDGVRFLVRFPRERIAELYRAADVFVLSSLFEMMPIALIEAAASGLPCMVHPEPTLAWIAGAGGVPTRMDDVDAFVASLDRLLRDQGERARIGSAARAHATAEFAADVIVERIVEYYGVVMADRA